MNQITDEFLLAQQVAGKIIERQRKQIELLEAERAKLAQIFAAFEERERVLRADLEEARSGH